MTYEDFYYQIFKEHNEITHLNMFYCITLIILIAVQIWPVRISSSRLLSSFDMIYTNMERRQMRINSGVRMDLEVSFELIVRGFVCVCVSVHACMHIHTYAYR